MIPTQTSQVSSPRPLLCCGLAIAGALAVVSKATAATTLLTMGFNNSNVDIIENATNGWNGTTVGAGGSLAANLILNTGLKIYGDFTPGVDATNVFHVDNWHTTNNLATTYVGFVVDAASGYALNLGDGDATFTTRLHQHTPSDTSMFNTVTLVVNGITIGSQSYTPGGGVQTLNWALTSANPALNGLTSADFRLLFSGVSNPSQGNRGPEWSVVDNSSISFAGNLFAVPEPTRGLLTFAGLGLMLLRRRRN